VTLAVGLSIPILRGKAPSIRREETASPRSSAALSLEKTKRETFDNAVLLQRNIEFWRKRPPFSGNRSLRSSSPSSARNSAGPSGQLRT
jgi:hypothetical protein